MARDQVITRDQIAAALTAYCKDRENSSFAEAVDGDKKFRFMPEGTPSDKDVQIWELNGKLKCSNTDFGMEFMNYLPQEPKGARLPENKAIVSTNGRKLQGEALVKAGATLTLEKVREYFCKTATDEECQFALEVCAIRGLNPFKLDCYFVKFDGKDAKLEIMVSKNFFLKRAEAHPDFEYLKAGVIVQKGEEVTEAERSFPYPGETLLGG